MSQHDRPAVSTDPAAADDGMNARAATAAWATTSAVCFGGATLSATKLFALAEKAGWDGSLAWLLFVILDGAALAGGLVWRYGRTSGARGYGAFVLIESTVLSILGNVAAHLAEATGRLPMIVVLAVGAIVPIQIVLTVHMAMLMSERPGATAIPALAADPRPLLEPQPAATEEAAVVQEAPPAQLERPAKCTSAEDGAAQPATPRIRPAELVSIEREAGRPDWVTSDMAPSAAMCAYLDRHGETPGAVLDRWADGVGLDKEFKPGLGRTVLARWKRDADRDSDGGRVAVGEA